MEHETDFCDRIPGCHTGRLSLELQASEAAEWQMRLEQMEKETQRLRHWIARQEAKIRELTASPAAGESEPISPEVPQAHGMTTPATPSAAAGASEPVAGDTVSRAEYDRVVKLMNHFRDVIAEYHDMALTDSKPEQSPPADSPDDWVTQDSVPARRGIDRCWVSLPGNEPSDNMALWWDCDCDDNAVGKMHGDTSSNPGWRLNVRCRRKDLPVVPGKAPVTKPPSSEMINADKPRMRQVTLREYVMSGKSYWTTSDAEIGFTDRTAVVEVPE